MSLLVCCWATGCGYLGLDLHELDGKDGNDGTGVVQGGDQDGGGDMGGAVAESGGSSQVTSGGARGSEGGAGSGGKSSDQGGGSGGSGGSVASGGIEGGGGETGSGGWWGGSGGNFGERWTRWRNEEGVSCEELSPLFAEEFSSSDVVVQGAPTPGTWGIDEQWTAQGAGELSWTDREGHTALGALVMQLDSRSTSRWRTGAFAAKTLLGDVDLTDGLLVIHAFSESGQNVSATLAVRDANGVTVRGNSVFLAGNASWDCLSLDLSGMTFENAGFDPSHVTEALVEVRGNWGNWNWSQNDLIVYLDDFGH